MLGGGPFHRELRNRRQLASPAGLAPVPFAGGGVDNDQGIGKAGSAMLRKHLVRMAWRWLRHQPDSALPAWFRDCVSARDGRSRRRGIVALARRLPVAPWRFATTGLVPQGAVLSQARARKDNGQPNTRAARRGLRGTRAGCVTVAEHGSPQDAAPAIGWVPPPGTWRRPNRASWSRGRHRPTEPDRSMDASSGASWNRDVLSGLPRWHGSRPRRREGRRCEAMKKSFMKKGA